MLDCLAHAKCPICRAAWSGTAGYSQAPSDIILADEFMARLDSRTGYSAGIMIHCPCQARTDL